LGDGDEKDDPKHLCVSLVENLPRCMHLITPEAVVERIELCLAAASLPQLTVAQGRELASFLSRQLKSPLPYMPPARIGSNLSSSEKLTPKKIRKTYAKH
jgi:hypothetical protein